ncbi:MAG TPA: hypothetical protein VMF89_29880, partial [Polyangiales bacterium]|nr:hypothetical protein [Polyangiales bacterium]
MKPLLRQLAWPLLAAVVLALDAEDVWARPGGGQSYSGDRHGGGRGGGDGGGDFSGELIYLLIRLIFFYPQIGIPLALIVAFVVWRMRNRGFESWDTSAVHAAVPAVRSRPPKLRLDALFAIDPDFSPIVFEDFAYRLYASAQRARSDRAALEGLAPFLAANVRDTLAREEPVGVPTTQVIVGAMRIARVDVPEAQSKVTVTVVYESNLSVGDNTFFLRESWTLSRDKAARTRPPEQTERLGCPNCGAPFESSDSARCNYCNEVVNNGRFAWLVTERRVLSREQRPPALTSDVQEVGTNAPSLVSPDQQQAW